MWGVGKLDAIFIPYSERAEILTVSGFRDARVGTIPVSRQCDEKTAEKGTLPHTPHPTP
ncbi:MAG: hypothetical protein F6J93_13960 [Oscillatoria sp. SIO1A7]|nr:hypothetical protein [Oscillatoria sp. SIO1A7]